MHSSYTSRIGVLYKAYEQYGDWQIIGSDGSEIWFSVWAEDVDGSLLRAFISASGDDITMQQIYII